MCPLFFYAFVTTYTDVFPILPVELIHQLPMYLEIVRYVYSDKCGTKLAINAVNVLFGERET